MALRTSRPRAAGTVRSAPRSGRPPGLGMLRPPQHGPAAALTRAVTPHQRRPTRPHATRSKTNKDLSQGSQGWKSPRTRRARPENAHHAACRSAEPRIHSGWNVEITVLAVWARLNASWGRRGTGRWGLGTGVHGLSRHETQPAPLQHPNAAGTAISDRSTPDSVNPRGRELSAGESGGGLTPRCHTEAHSFQPTGRPRQRPPPPPPTTVFTAVRTRFG